MSLLSLFVSEQATSKQPKQAILVQPEALPIFCTFLITAEMRDAGAPDMMLRSSYAWNLLASMASSRCAISDIPLHDEFSQSFSAIRTLPCPV
jgi:hypothetical protein